MKACEIDNYRLQIKLVAAGPDTPPRRLPQTSPIYATRSMPEAEQLLDRIAETGWGEPGAEAGRWAPLSGHDSPILSPPEAEQSRPKELTNRVVKDTLYRTNNSPYGGTL